MKKILFFFFLTITTVTSNAQRIDALGQFLSEQIPAVDTALNKENQDEEESWDLRNFYLRFVTSVTFTVYYIANIQISPQIELVWHHNEGNH